MLFAALMPSTTARATQAVAPEVAREALIQKMRESYAAAEKTGEVKKVSKRLEKKVTKLLKKLQKAAIDLDDPVDKWMWFWLLSWGASIVIGILLSGWLARLLFAAGTIFLIIWLIRRGGV